MNKFLLILLLLTSGSSLLADTSVIHTLPSGIEGMRNTSPQKESVICVHAFLRSYSSLKPIGHALEKDNYDVFIWNYETRKFTLEKHADHLLKLIKKIAELKPGVPIHFVTHSIGGVIARVALSRPDCPSEATHGRAVFMAPPNAGSVLARRYGSVRIVQFVFGGKLGRQLLTYSPEKMLDVGKLPSTVDVLIICGNRKSKFIPFHLDCENDGKVCTVETKLDTPHKYYVIKANHTYIIANKKSIFLIREFLKEGSQAQAITEMPESIEKKVKESQQNTTKFNHKKRNVYVIHCFGSRPYKLYGFPKKWKPSSSKNTEIHLGK